MTGRDGPPGRWPAAVGAASTILQRCQRRWAARVAPRGPKKWPRGAYRLIFPPFSRQAGRVWRRKGTAPICRPLAARAFGYGCTTARFFSLLMILLLGSGPELPEGRRSSPPPSSPRGPLPPRAAGRAEAWAAAGPRRRRPRPAALRLRRRGSQLRHRMHKKKSGKDPSRKPLGFGTVGVAGRPRSPASG